MAKSKNDKNDGSDSSETISAMNKSIDINYIKTNNYRTYYIDGVYGGLTPNGRIYMELFIERLVTPQVVKHDLSPDKGLGKEISRIGKQGIIREIESGVMMDIETAKVVATWLNGKIIELETKLKKIKE